MLHAGRLARYGMPDAVITPESLKQIYGVDVMVNRVATEVGGERRVCLPAVRTP
jgi:ABC-type hemin transport system ATPase subunit